MSHTKKLIALVQERRLLYDLSHDDHKNREKKAEAWQEIASEMGIEDGKYWISKWKSLRDNYNKFKKNKEFSSAQAYKKYKNWPWAARMKFLDESKTRRASCNAIDEISGSQASTSNSQVPTEIVITDLNSVEDVTNFVKRKRNMENIADTSDKLCYKSEENSKLDGVDYFFLSYAQTFKQLPTRMQTILKLEIATLFARYELQAEEAIDANIPPKMPIHLSQRGGNDSCSLRLNSLAASSSVYTSSTAHGRTQPQGYIEETKVHKSDASHVNSLATCCTTNETKENETQGF